MALKHYFLLVATEDPTHATDHIVKLLPSKYTLAYLEFLSFQLQHFDTFNPLFQSEKPLLQRFKEEVEGPIKSISTDFMDVPYVKATNPKNVPLLEVYLGVAATATINEIKKDISQDDVDLYNFMVNHRNFLCESIEQIKRRFDLDDEIDDVVQCIYLEKQQREIHPP